MWNGTLIVNFSNDFVQKNSLLLISVWIVGGHNSVKPSHSFEMAITQSKIVQIKRMRCFLTSTENSDVKKISYVWFGQFLTKLWPSKVLMRKNRLTQIVHLFTNSVLWKVHYLCSYTKWDRWCTSNPAAPHLLFTTS